MSFPTGLFVDAPEMQDVSLHALGEDIEAWPEELIQKLKERVPQSNGMSMVVKFMKKDDENGAATGSIVVASADKQAIVPVIIKDFMLYPLDVFICDKKLIPLTPDYFEGSFNNNKVFQKMEEYPAYGGLGRFEDSNLWNATYPPSLGRYAYASGGYPVLDAISETIDPTEWKAYLQANPAVAAGFHKHGHAELIKKVANLRPVNMNEFRQGADNLIKRDIVMLRKEGPNKYTILSNSDKVFSPVLVKGMGQCDLAQFASGISDHAEDDINDVDQNGEKMLRVTTVPAGIHIEGDNASLPVELANEFDHYVVRKKNGVEVEGYVIPKVVGFNMERVDLKIFIGKTMSTMQGEIAGIRMKNSAFKMPACAPRAGQTGTFVHQPDASHGLATIPVTIKSVVDDCGSKHLHVVDLNGISFKVTLTSTVLDRIAPTPDGYLLPDTKFKWVPMQGFEEVTNSAVDFAVKVAGTVKTANPVKVLYTGYGQYAIRGLDKYAYEAGWTPMNLEEYQVKFLLSSLGASQEKVAHICKKARASTQAIVHNLNLPPLKAEKIAAALPVARKMAKVASDLRCNLTKEASFVENSQTVDTLLSLNFVNPENIAKLVGKLPSFKASISSLASMLIASRLGVREIPEGAASTAMMRLVEVVNGLEALRATQEKQ
jgi:hypothetical protein